MLKFVGSRRPSFNMLIVTLLEFIDIISKIYPKDSTIRIAPTFPSVEELRKAAEVFVICVRLASVNKILETK